MKICIVQTNEDTNIISKDKFIKGRLSYIADGASLKSEALSPEATGGIMIVICDSASEDAASPIYEECKKRAYSAVFLDAAPSSFEKQKDVLEKISSVLTLRGLTVYIPLSFSENCPWAIPVAECGVSGGSICEYITELHNKNQKLALSIPITRASFDMPFTGGLSHPLSEKELLSLKFRFDSNSFFSREMLTNYFIYSPRIASCRYVLFDDATSIREKLSLSKRLKIHTVFLVWNEVESFFEEIFIHYSTERRLTSSSSGVT